MKKSKESTKETKVTTKTVLGAKLPINANNETKIFLIVADKFKGQSITWKTFVNEARAQRVNPILDLKPYNELTPKTKTNFDNRICRLLGATKIVGLVRKSVQSKKFNSEAVTSTVVKFEIPIDSAYNISPQVKQQGQSFTIGGKIKYRKTDVKATKTDLKKFDLFKARFKKS